jgi:predicted RNA-binding protein
LIESKFKERNAVQKPTCPFCATPLERPVEGRSSPMPTGSCGCGAVYVCDVTGHNLGTALVDALLLACGGDSATAWDLMPEEDYIERQLTDYDYDTHQIIQGGVYQGRRIAGALLFIRLIKGTVEERFEPGTAGTQASRADEGRATAAPLSKKEVEDFVGSYKIEPLLASASGDKRILRHLKRLLYSPDELLRLRAAEVLGRVSAVISCTEPQAVTRLLQELFSSVTDTAASTWGAIDAIGEIIRFQPDGFSSFIPRLAQFSRDRALLEDVLRALAKIGAGRPEVLHMNAGHLVRLLEDQDPRIQGYAAMLTGFLKIDEARAGLERLRQSRAELTHYENGHLRKKTIGEIAAEAIARI